MVKVIKEAFVVIGKMGSTLDGEGFMEKALIMDTILGDSQANVTAP